RIAGAGESVGELLVVRCHRMGGGAFRRAGARIAGADPATRESACGLANDVRSLRVSDPWRPGPVSAARSPRDVESVIPAAGELFQKTSDQVAREAVAAKPAGRNHAPAAVLALIPAMPAGRWRACCAGRVRCSRACSLRGTLCPDRGRSSAAPAILQTAPRSAMMTLSQ